MTKKTKQENLGEYIQTIEKKLKEGFTGTIIKIETATNEDYFGKEGMYGRKDGYVVTVQLDQDNTTFTQWFSKPSLTGYEKSNIYAFKKKYGSVPKVNVKVDIIIDDSGFSRISY